MPLDALSRIRPQSNLGIARGRRREFWGIVRGVGALLTAGVWFIVVNAMSESTRAQGSVPGGTSPDRLVLSLVGAATLVVAMLGMLLMLEMRRRLEHQADLARDRAILAQEISHGEEVLRRLRESEARLQDFARTASDWFWEQDADLRFISIGAETPLLLPGDRSHIGKRRWEMNDTSEAPERWEKHKQDLLQRRPFRDFRYSRMGPDGTMVHVSINGVPVYDAVGNFTGYRGTGRDITRAVTAEAELRAAKERAEKAEMLLRDAVDSMSEGFVIFDHEDRLVLCNEPYRRLYPESVAWMVPGTRFVDILRNGIAKGDYPDMVGREEEFFAERMLCHTQADSSMEQRRGNGRWVLITERRMRNGGIAGLRMDITQLKQTQLALRETERRVRDFAETSSDWFWEQDQDARFTWIGESCPVLTADAANYQGKHRWDFPSARATPEEKWQKHRATLEARLPFRDFRYALRDEHGTLRHVTVSGNPVFDPDGRFLGYRGTGRDITAEVVAAAELRDAKERAEHAESLLSDAVDSMAEGFVIFDHEDRFVMCNEAYRRICGPGADVLVPGTRFEDLVQCVLERGGHPDAVGRETAWRNERLHMHREAASAMEEQLTADRWILSTDRRMKSGGIAGLRVDISALKQTQAALRESEARLDRAQQIAGIGSWELDVETGRYVWSKELYRIRGLSPENFQPELGKVALYVHPDDYPVARRWLADLCKGVEREAFEMRIVRPDGSVRTLQVEGRPMVEPDGAIRRVAGTMQDITGRRLMEQQLAQAQKMEAIGRLTGGMAHDFNNVLGVIIGNLELLGRAIGDNPAAHELHAEVLDGAQRGAELTRRLLAFARRQPLRPQQTEVNALVEGIGRLLGRILGENIALDLQLGTGLPPVLVDPIQLEAALTNLATNARDAMPQGGRLVVTTKTARLDGRYVQQHPDVRPGDYVAIEVSDTGTGIPKELLGRIFEPFFTTKEPGKGSGLGLSMVLGFIQQSGGHVAVSTEQRRGTTFRLYLPPSLAREIPDDAESQERPVPGGNESILLVEDNAPLRRATAQQLTALGYRVREADDAVAALDFLRTKRRVDLLFTDIVMPGSIDGVELAQRATELRAGIRVLLASGFPEAHSRDGAVAPNLPLLNKPYRREDLARAVRQALDSPAPAYASA